MILQLPIMACSWALARCLQAIEIVQQEAVESSLALVGASEEKEHESACLHGPVFLYERFDHFATIVRQLADNIFQEVR